MRRLAILVSILVLLLNADPLQAQWGLVGCSTTDSAAIFKYDVPSGEFLIGNEFSLGTYGNYPYDAVRRPDADEVWIPGASGDGVVVVGPNEMVLHEIPTGEYPVSVAFNPRQDLALVSCRDSDRIDLISTQTYEVVGSLDIAGTYLGPGNIIFDVQGDRFFAVSWYDDTLFEIAPDGSAITDQITLGNDLWQLVIDPLHDGWLLVTDRGQDLIHVLDPETLAVERTVPVGDDPWGLDVDWPFAVVSCEDSGDVYLIDMETWDVQPLDLPAGADPRDVNMTTGWASTGGRTLLGAMAYVTGGNTGIGSPLYVIDFQNGTIEHELMIPGTNTNVVAVEAQWLISSGVGDVPALEQLALKASPNPFNPLTDISFHLEEAADVRLAVYDLAGRLVRRLDQGHRLAGRHQVPWDGRDRTGRLASSGVYQVRIETGLGVATTKVVLAK